MIYIYIYRCCPGFVSVLFRSCLGLVLVVWVMSREWRGDVSVMFGPSRCCCGSSLGLVAVMSRSCFGVAFSDGAVMCRITSLSCLRLVSVGCFGLV